MSFSPSGGNGGRPGMMSEINVTPMVDVMLVLLIIFMVAAPMMTQGLEVTLPDTEAAKALPTEEKQTVLTIKSDGTVFLDEFQVTTANLAHQVSAAMKANNSKTVFLRADRATSYGDVAVVMGQLRAAGVTNIGLVTDPVDKSAAGASQGPQPMTTPSVGGSAPAPAAQAPATPPTAPVRSAAPGN